MINLLCNIPNFDESWAMESLYGLMHKDMHVLIMPLAEDTGWSMDGMNEKDYYRKGTRAYEKTVRPFINYQIAEKNIEWFHRFEETHETALAKINRSDVIYLIGNHSDQMMDCLHELNLINALRNYTGIMIGNTCGSKILLDTFDSDYAYEEEQTGIGRLRGFALETGYIEDVRHLKHMIDTIEGKGKAVFGCPNKGGILIQDGHYELLGDAFTCNEEDLDRIYAAFEDAKSRYEYYGDNGNY